MDPKPVKDSVTVMSQVMSPSDANSLGNVHGGVIMKLIDSTAGVAAARHACLPAVTASIDRLDFINPCNIADVVTFKASVNHAGKTSMEVGVRVEAENVFRGDKRLIAKAYLTFVALDRDRKPAPVPPVLPITEDEKRRHDDARQRREIRLASRIKDRDKNRSA